MSDIQRDREERQHVIEVLQNMVDWMQKIDYIVATPERIHALGYAIASIKTDLKYDLMYEGALEQEPRKGHWIETAEEYYKAINEKGGGVNEDTDYFTDDIACSECLAKFSVIDNEAERFDFCPCCGSDNK